MLSNTLLPLSFFHLLSTASSLPAQPLAQKFVYQIHDESHWKQVYEFTLFLFLNIQENNDMKAKHITFALKIVFDLS